MKKDLEKIDELIKAALSSEEAEFYDELEEQNLLGKLEGIYRGKLGWLAVIMNIIHLLLLGLFILCAVNFFQTPDMRELITWGSGGFLCMMAMAMLKIYMWMQMDKNDILRELKRIELQISALSAKSHSGKE